MPTDPLLVQAVLALASVDDGAVTQDGVGFNGSDTKFGNAIAKVPAEAWQPEVQREVWEMLAKYKTQLASVGIDYSAITEPKASNKLRGVRCVDVRNGAVLVFLPWGDSAYPKVALGAFWNSPVKGWQVSVAKYGSVLQWAERNKIPVTDRAKAILSSAPTPDKKEWAGSAVLEKGEIVIKFDYNPIILDAVRTIQGRRWNATDKTWVIPKTSVTLLRRIAEEHQIFMSLDVQRLPDVEVITTPTIAVHGRNFALSFNYDSEMISQVRQMPGSVWSPPIRAWLVPIESSDEVLKFAEQHKARLSEEAKELLHEAEGVQAVIDASQAKDAQIWVNGLGNDTFQPFPFQRAGIAYAMRSMGYEHHEGNWTQTEPTTGGVLIGDEMGLGKGNVHGTKVLTPKGWTNIENLAVGDTVIGSNGRATTITGVFPRGVIPTYRVSFNDGSETIVDGEHLWAVQSVQNGHRNPDKWLVKETKDLANQLIDGAGNLKWRIPLVQPVEFEGQNEPLPIDPYLLGLLLGDGAIGGAKVHISSADSFIVQEVSKRIPSTLSVKHLGNYDYAIISQHAGSPNVLRRTLDAMGLRQKSGSKFIPEKYLRSSAQDRLALLRGLMDTDGHAGAEGTNEYVSISKDLADGVAELVLSLGGVVRRNTKQPTKNGEPYGELAYRVNIKLMDCPFLLPRKVEAWKKPTKYTPSRNIKSIEPMGDAPVTCISVDAPDHLYVIEHYLVTHNTVQGIGVLQAAQAFPAVVVCPASLKLNWEREINRWIPHARVKVISGTTGNTPDADVYVVNYDILTHWVEKLPPLKGIVLDESHYIKNGSAQRSKACVKLSDKVVEGGVRVCLSGTAIVNTPTEIITQLRVINRLDEFGGATAFRGTYGRANAKSLASLNRKLRSSCYVRRRKAEVLTELPPKIWSTVLVEGDPTIMKEYKKAEADIIKYLAQLALELARESGATDKEAQNEAWRKAMRARGAEQLVSITTLKQLAAKAKMKSAQEWIDNFLEQDKKLVVFGWHRDVVDMVADKFSNGVKIQGGLTGDKRQQAVDLFQNSDDQKVIACNIKAAGVGLTLTAASDVLFLEQGWTPSDMEQGADRCHRIGQKDSVTAWLMLTANTIDEDIAMLIDHKRSIVNRAIDGSLDDEEEVNSMIGDLIVSLAERGMETLREE
jgi:hypothetical protein